MQYMCFSVWLISQSIMPSGFIHVVQIIGFSFLFPTETEEVKKRWQEYTEELYKKSLNDPDNYYGVVTDPEPDIIECDVNWALRSIQFSSVQFSSVAQPYPTLCDPRNPSIPGLPIHHQLLELTQTHVHQVGDAIQPSYPLSSPSPPAPDPSQHQGLFQ